MSVMVNRTDQVQMIKDAIDIVDVIAQYTTLTPAGKRMKGLSPFTNEKTPSFFVDPDAGVYYCFSSQKGGDIFSFVQDMEGIDFKEALQMLAERAGIDITTTTKSKKNNESLYHLLESAETVYQNHLTKEVKRYLIDRGISEGSIQEWKIGYAPDSWNTLCSKKTPNLAENVLAGMCIENKEKESVYDRFRNRIQFPFHDEQKRVIGFSGRMYGDDEGAKYINSPESPLFKKSSFLYGLHKAKLHIRKHNCSILTEGPIDAIMIHQAGYPMAVATSGTAVTEAHLQKLKRLSNRILIALDGDAAGQRAALRVIEMACEIGMDTKVIILPDEEDPADVIAQDADLFKKMVREAVPATAFLTTYIKKQYGGNSEDHIRGMKEVALPIIAKNKDPMSREHMIKEIAEFCGLSFEAVQENMQRIQEGITTKNTETAPLRKKKPAPTQKEINTKEKKINTLLHTVAMATQFLKNNNKPINESYEQMLHEVQKYTTLPKIDEKVVQVRYDTESATKDEQIQNAQDELGHAVKHLAAEYRKKEELEKLRKET